MGGAPANSESQSWGWTDQILPDIDKRELWQLANDNAVGDTIRIPGGGID